MTCFRFIELLLFLLFSNVYSEESEPIFKAEREVIQLGNCFAMDYIVVYRSASEGDQLLGNSSNKNMPNTPPADLQGRTHISDDPNLLGFQISNLTHLDSGIYRRECWKNQTIINQKTQQLTVCKEQIESEDIIVSKDGKGTEILCNNNAIGSEGTSVRWYHEMYPSYEPTLFLDSSVSLKPLVKELAGVVDVRDNGALLVFNNMLQKTTHFKCVVMKGVNCLSFQTMHPPDESESKDVFVSLGDRVLLNCSIDEGDQAWETPLGRIDSNTRGSPIYISADDFSLVIPAISADYIGDYSCISLSREMHYALFLCPKNKLQEKVADEGENVSLMCDSGQEVSAIVQWHRYGLTGHYEIIHDSQDKTVPIPKDLRGRVTLSEDGTLLTINDLKVSDGGKYICAVVKTLDFAGNYMDYDTEYDDKGTEEDETDKKWTESLECIFKQEITLNLPSSSPPPHMPYVVVAVVVLLVVAGVIVTVIVIKKKARPLPLQREATLYVKMDMDPGCTEKMID
ncbi:uncharacterized protein LOC102212246 [Pundamilia nyererei]|uniref:Uncharacterized protein LOC102212246 n=1 Tax=Pundamilia nyererei TaxID=303518 RepID=A0A9Y3VF64_9CICH|nr:PREDICTED: uncharacterized protein LOC102212246 [Pundamilia nyererei]